MKLFKKILDKNDLKVDKYTMKGKTMIVNTPLGQFALKKGNLDNIYKYLLSRNFEYFPKCIEKYASVCPPRIVDDWLPFLYATIKNKWIYAIVCGLLFGGAHLLAGKFKLINLLYLIPYGSLGFVFALMNRETKTTFSSITMHCIHNTATGILLLVTYSMGVL